MADTAAPAPSPIWDIVKAAVPYLGQVLVLVATFGTGWAANHYLRPDPKPILAADPPRPTPIACAQELHDLDTKGSAIRADLAILRQLIDERIPASTPRAAPSKLRLVR